MRAFTFPSHTAILTGRYPAAFGIRLNGIGALPPKATTLAERLKTAGYRTGAVVASAVLAETYGLDQGFDGNDDRIAIQAADTVALADLNRPADQVTAAARKWIASAERIVVSVGALLRSALPYEAPAKYAALRRNVRTTGKSHSRTRRSPRCSDRSTVSGRRGGDRRSRRITRRTRRTRSRILPLRLDAQRAADHRRSGHQASHRVRAGAPHRSTGDDRRARRPHAPQAGGEDGESLVPLVNGRIAKRRARIVAESWYPRLHFGWSELRRPAPASGSTSPRQSPSSTTFGAIGGNEECRHRAGGGRRPPGGGAQARRRSIRAGAADAQRAARSGNDSAASIARLSRLLRAGPRGRHQRGSQGPHCGIRQYPRRSVAPCVCWEGEHAEAAAALQQLVKMNVRGVRSASLSRQRLRRARERPTRRWESTTRRHCSIPRLSTPHIEAAKVLSNRNQHAPAIVRCRKGLDLSPRSDYGHYTLGVIYRRAQRPAEASTRSRARSN